MSFVSAHHWVGTASKISVSPDPVSAAAAATGQPQWLKQDKMMSDGDDDWRRQQQLMKRLTWLTRKPDSVKRIVSVMTAWLTEKEPEEEKKGELSEHYRNRAKTAQFGLRLFHEKLKL